ncbi:hypothetical protein N9L68_02780 [bacterium]|nr:hypothetical protein [bacterium]
MPEWAHRLCEWSLGLRGHKLREAALAVLRQAVLIQRAAEDDAAQAACEGRVPSPTRSWCKRELPPDEEGE